MKISKKLIYILPLAALVACEPEFDDVSFDSGNADFSNYVSVGNSLTAGYQSNALRRVRQENSYPAILAGQMQQVGGGAFVQPLLDEGVGVGSALNAEYSVQLVGNCLGEIGPAPLPIALNGQSDQFNFLDPTKLIGVRNYNNLGVPGAKSYHLLANGFGNPLNVPLQLANPFYARFVDVSNMNQNLIEAAVENNPTFFSLWIGNNDVLSYATTAGSGVDQTGNPNVASYGGNDITDPTVFAIMYAQMLDSLTKNGAKGVVANIPDITSIPYFNTVPRNSLVLKDQAQVDQLNGAYSAYNSDLDSAVAYGEITPEAAQRRNISFHLGANMLVMKDDIIPVRTLPNGTFLPNLRQMKGDDYLILITPGDSIRCAGWGSLKAIESSFVLAGHEATNISEAVASYNQSIKQLANQYGLAFVDANAILKGFEGTGAVYDGVNYSSAFITGGVFSLDGVHPNTRGYAIIANAHIDAINAKYGSNLPKVNVNAYEGVIFPDL